MFGKATVKLQLHDAIYRLRFYSNSLIHILSLSNSHNDVASIQKNRSDKSHRVIVRVIVALNYAIYWLLFYSNLFIRVSPAHTMINRNFKRIGQTDPPSI